MKIFLLLAVLILFSSLANASETEIRLGRFSNGDLSGWKEQTIGLMKQKTIYAFSRERDALALVGRSSNAASGYIYKLKIDPKDFPILKWSWKIDHIIKKGDEKIKEGDDFAVRIYVLFPRGFFSETRALCYVWANKLAKGEHVVSPFTKNVFTIAEDSGSEHAGRWTFHQRNIYEDYKNLFGEEPPKVGAVALMTDTDNTGESAVGYYGDISLQRKQHPEEPKGKEQKLPQKQPQQAEPPREPVGGSSPALPPTPAPVQTPPIKP